VTLFKIENPSPEVVPISYKGIHFSMLRLDKTHKEISGNKWYKLKYNLLNAEKNHFKTILTFGGAYSNHIRAVAAVAKHFSMRSIGVIRGESHNVLNPTLSFAQKQGMKIHYISREQYRLKTNQDFIQSLKDQFGEFYLIPEGGTNSLAVQGAAEILEGFPKYDFVCVPVGTGGTMAGLIRGTPDQTTIYGFPVVRDQSLEGTIESFVSESCAAKWQLFTNYHFGGYARFDDSLIEFINAFKASTGVPLDPIYTGKMIFGVFDMMKKGLINTASRVLAIHTGGLQGIEGFNQRFGELI